MRTLLIITCLANIAFAFGSLPWQPDKVAMHFSLDGTPNSFMPAIANAVLMTIFTGIIAAIMLGTSALVAMAATHMPEHFNVPNREYWLNDENRPGTILRVCFSCEMIGVGTMLFILYVQWIIFRANQTAPPNLDGLMLMCVAGVFVAYIVFDQVRLYRSFCRLPEESEPQEPQV